ncbi:MAG: hypothetical protein JO051_10975 [Acidobacteriaceae bacterium]|nr:hypothetical protein [Acidobacteriaceae bacterium]
MRFEVMASKPPISESRLVSGEMNQAIEQRQKQQSNKNQSLLLRCRVQTNHPPQIEEKNQMNKLFTSTLLTAVAVPFLMAAPAAKKAQNTSTSSSTTTSATKVHKKKSKKNGTSSTESSTTSTSTSQK